MESALSIQEFSTKLEGDSSSQLLATLRQVAVTARPEDVRQLAKPTPEGSESSWTGWGW
jgi:hypothetical protein